MSKQQKRITIILTSLCLAIIILRQSCPGFILDEKFIFFFSVGAIPWFIPFFKKLEISNFKMEFKEGSEDQITSSNPPENANVDFSINTKLNKNSIKVLATLWHYQTERYGENYTTKWTFNIFPNSPSFPYYLNGIAELVNLGFISVVSETNQVFLTNLGIEYINKNPDIKLDKDIYRF